MDLAHWPLFGLRVRTERVELRPADDDDLSALANAAAAGIHGPDAMPFDVPWSEQPPGVLERGVVQHGWKVRAGWSVGAWNLPLAVVVDGAVVGSQNLFAHDFLVTRQVETGSWLTRAAQGRGTGKEMRAAALALAFSGLGAEHAVTGAYVDNPTSLGVTRSLGYEPDGMEVRARKGRPVQLLRFRMDRAGWDARTRPTVTVTGLEPCLPMFGLAPDLTPLPDVTEPMI
jgi:RimJ/RimL family protein N-acetyltransferase